MKKIKVLVEGVTSLVGGRETYIMTQYECIDTSCFHFDFVYDLSVGEFPERYIGEVTSKGSKVFYLRTRQEWKDFLQNHTDYDFLILNLMSTCSIYYYRELNESSSFKKIILHSHIARNYPFRGFDRIGQRKELKSLRKRFDSLNIAKWACSDIAGKWMFGEDSDFEVIKNIHYKIRIFSVVIIKFFHNDLSTNFPLFQWNTNDNASITLLAPCIYLPLQHFDPVILSQYLHLADCYGIQPCQPFRLGHPLADKYGVQIFQIGKAHELRNICVIPDIALQLRVTIPPLLCGHAKQSHVQDICFTGVNEGNLLGGEFRRDQVLLDGVGMDAIIDFS